MPTQPTPNPQDTRQQGFQLGGVRIPQAAPIPGAPPAGAALPPTNGGSSRPSIPAPQVPAMPTSGVQLNNLQGRSSAEIAEMRRQVEARRNQLMESFKTTLTTQEEELQSRLRVASEQRDGAEYNYNSAVKELAKSKRWWTFRGLGDKLGGLTSTYQQQKDSSYSMWADHKTRVTELTSNLTQGRAKKELALQQMQQVLDNEVRKLELMEQLKEAEESSNFQERRRISDQLSTLMSTASAQERQAERNFVDAITLFADKEAIDYAKHQKMLSDINTKLAEGISRLDTTEQVFRTGTKIVIICAAGAFAFSTCGAGSGVLVAALYGFGVAGGVGLGAQLAVNSAEMLGHAAAGNKQPRSWQEALVVDPLKTGVEAGVTGLGMGWASHASKAWQARHFVTVGGKLVPRLGSGPSFLLRHRHAIGNAWRMATPNTFFHTSRDLATGNLKADPASIFISVGFNYLTASMCAGNSSMGNGLRQSLRGPTLRQAFGTTTLRNLFANNQATRQAARQAITRFTVGTTLRTGHFGFEKYLNMYIEDWNAHRRAILLGWDVNSEAYKSQREQNRYMAVLGDLTGEMTNARISDKVRGSQRRVDTVAEGADTRARAQQENSMLAGDAPETVVRASGEPDTSRHGSTPRTDADMGDATNRTRIEMSNDERLAMSEAGEANGVVDRSVTRNLDTDGHVTRMTEAERNQARSATDSMSSVRPETTGVLRRFRNWLGGFVPTANLHAGERSTWQRALEGSQQSEAQTRKVVSDAFDGSLNNNQLKAIVEDLGSRKLSTEQKIARIEEHIGRRLDPDADADAAILGKLRDGKRGLKSDTTGEVEDAYIRASKLEALDGDPEVVRQSLEADGRQLVDDGVSVANRYRQGYTRRNRGPIAWTFGKVRDAGSWLSTRIVQPAGRGWSNLQKLPFGMGEVFLTLDMTGRTAFTATAQLGMSAITAASPTPLLGNRLIVDLLMGSQNISSRFVAEPIRRAMASPTSPETTIRAIAVHDQIQHRLDLIDQFQRQGGTIDPDVVTALRQTQSDLNVVINQSSRRRGFIHRTHNENNPSDGRLAIRDALHSAADRGMRYSTQSQVEALYQQGLRAINDGGPNDYLRALHDLGNQRIQADVMQEIIRRWELANGGPLDLAPPNNAPPANGAAQNGHGGNNRAAARIARRNRAAGNANADSDIPVNLDTVFRMEMFDRARADIDAWIQNPSPDNLAQARRAMSQIEGVAVDRQFRAEADASLTDIAAQARARRATATADQQASLNRLAEAAEALSGLDGRLRDIVTGRNNLDAAGQPQRPAPNEMANQIEAELARVRAAAGDAFSPRKELATLQDLVDMSMNHRSRASEKSLAKRREFMEKLFWQERLLGSPRQVGARERQRMIAENLAGPENRRLTAADIAFLDRMEAATVASTTHHGSTTRQRSIQQQLQSLIKAETDAHFEAQQSAKFYEIDAQIVRLDQLRAQSRRTLAQQNGNNNGTGTTLPHIAGFDMNRPLADVQDIRNTPLRLSAYDPYAPGQNRLVTSNATYGDYYRGDASLRDLEIPGSWRANTRMAGPTAPASPTPRTDGRRFWQFQFRPRTNQRMVDGSL